MGAERRMFCRGVRETRCGLGDQLLPMKSRHACLVTVEGFSKVGQPADKGGSKIRSGLMPV